ncbi:hypothetical protein F0562_013780 [Nyssa sinensis]|uniref:MADS-box domain-containing protein n=1 Tax=Nyssa sinensis TaxID=561372 RepID=A0A5J4ZNV6_9ASTE|nr:hypothetical protein F0562_013780 [Nyssa sinensis]
MGRQKIEIKKIEKKNNLQVTFSKRRTGLFKKAAQLGALCGAEVAVIVMSPAKNVYAFGNPSADSVIDRFLARNSSASNPKTTPSSPPHDVLHSCEAVGGLEAVKEREKTVEESKEVSGGGFRWDEPIDELGLDELEQYMASLEVLKKKVRTRANEIAMAKRFFFEFLGSGWNCNGAKWSLRAQFNKFCQILLSVLQTAISAREFTDPLFFALDSRCLVLS